MKRGFSSSESFVIKWESVLGKKYFSGAGFMYFGCWMLDASSGGRLEQEQAELAR